MNHIPHQVSPLSLFIDEHQKTWKTELLRIEQSLESISKLKNEQPIEITEVNENLKELFCLLFNTEILSRDTSKWTYEKKISLFQLSDAYLDSSINHLSLAALNLTTTHNPKKYRLILDQKLAYHAHIKNSCPLNRIVILQAKGLKGEELTTLLSTPQFPNIRSLSFEGCAFSEQQLKSIKKQLANLYPNLNSLTLKGSEITNKTAKLWIKPFKNSLNILKLQQCHDQQLNDFFGYFIAQFPQPKALSTFHLIDCKAITHKIIKKICKTCSKLASLDLGNCPNISEKVISKIIKYNNSLTSLGLSNHKYLTDDLLKNIVNHFGETLTSLDISGCDLITDDAITAIAKHCPNLTHINLERCPNLTNTSIEMIVNSSLNLKSIYLKKHSGLTDKQILMIAERFGKTLETISIQSCNQVTEESAYCLAKNCRSLSLVYIWDCVPDPLKILEILIQEFPNLYSRYQKMAIKGSASYQYILGLCYTNGIGTLKNEQEAPFWYKKAADQGHAQAQFNLGECYHKGTGVNKNEVESALLFHKSANQNHPKALLLLSRDAQTQYYLGTCFLEGKGIGKNTEEAVVWFQKAADLNHADALSVLGQCYQKGIGIKSNDKKAVEFYEKAARQDHVIAQYYLGMCYANGTYLRINKEKALCLFKKAADKNYAPAEYAIGEFYENGDLGTNKSINEAYARIWYERAAKNGNRDAQNKLNPTNCSVM